MAKEEIKILSIEDDEFMRIFLKDVFWVHGMQAKDDVKLTMVDSFKKVKDILCDPSTRPDIILLDLMVPDENEGIVDREAGFHFLEEIKTNKDTKDIKVIIFSGFSDKEIKDKATKLGADRFLVKGEYLPKELINAIHEVASN
jgi:DNA-binding NarL/FixJ family response regulator